MKNSQSEMAPDTILVNETRAMYLKRVRMMERGEIPLAIIEDPEDYWVPRSREAFEREMGQYLSSEEKSLVTRSSQN